jgi:hypothetical protein
MKLPASKIPVGFDKSTTELWYELDAIKASKKIAQRLREGKKKGLVASMVPIEKNKKRMNNVENQPHRASSSAVLAPDATSPMYIASTTMVSRSNASWVKHQQGQKRMHHQVVGEGEYAKELLQSAAVDAFVHSGEDTNMLSMKEGMCITPSTIYALTTMLGDDGEHCAHYELEAVTTLPDEITNAGSDGVVFTPASYPSRSSPRAPVVEGGLSIMELPLAHELLLEKDVPIEDSSFMLTGAELVDGVFDDHI